MSPTFYRLTSIVLLLVNVCTVMIMLMTSTSSSIRIVVGRLGGSGSGGATATAATAGGGLLVEAFKSSSTTTTTTTTTISKGRTGPSFLGMVLADPTKRTTSHHSLSGYQPQQQPQQCPKNLEPLVICGPSGVGKGTIIELLMKQYSLDASGGNNDNNHNNNNSNNNNNNKESAFGFCVSHTTRQPRPGEIHGIHYYFTSIDEIQRDIQDGKFVEHAYVHGNYYGTSKRAIEDVQQQQKITILDIDMQGVMAVKESGITAKYIFITPPSLQELENRLRGRGTETEEAIQKRLTNAAKEIAYGHGIGHFDHVVVNDHIDQTVHEMKTILQGWYPQLI
jgi:guanylate kinase